MVVYVDNMLAYSISMEGHGRSSVSLSLKLHEHCLCAKFSKREFWLLEVTYLGHVLLLNTLLQLWNQQVHC